MRIFSNPLITLVIGIVVGAKAASKVNGLPLINKIPSV